MRHLVKTEIYSKLFHNDLIHHLWDSKLIDTPQKIFYFDNLPKLADFVAFLKKTFVEIAKTKATMRQTKDYTLYMEEKPMQIQEGM